MTNVVFRKRPEKEGGDVLALFPEEPYAGWPGFTTACQSGAPRMCGPSSYPSCIRSTRAAAPEEYAPLLAELVSLGYDDLNICTRKPMRRKSRTR